MTGYRLSPAARADLEEIWTFTAERWDFARAEKCVYAIRDRLASGTIAAQSAADVRPGYFRCACGSHMIYFQRGDSGMQVVRMLHQSMDANARFREI